jgi:hypothetical protein
LKGTIVENVETNAASTTAATAPQSVETPPASTTGIAKEPEFTNYADYEHYRLTGELPKTTEDTPKTEASAPSKETAGADDSAEAAPVSAPDKKQEPQQRRGAPEEKRVPQLLSERNAEKRAREAAEARVRDLEAQIAGKKPDEKKADSSTAAPTRTKPTPEDVDAKTGQPKFASYEDYVEDLADWKVEQREAQREATQQAERDKQTKAERDREAAAQRTSDEQTLGKTHEEGKKLFKDYDTVLFGENSPLERIPEASAMDRYLMRTIREDSGIGAKLLYHLAKNGAVVDRIRALDADGQQEAMVELKLGLKKAPENKPSNAPTPPATVGAHGAAPNDPEEAAVQKGNFGDFERARLAKK